MIARKISKLIDIDVYGTVHVGGNRKTVFEYAKGLDENRDIGELSINDVAFQVPVDTSLECNKYNDILSKEVIK